MKYFKQVILIEKPKRILIAVDIYTNIIFNCSIVMLNTIKNMAYIFIVLTMKCDWEMHLIDKNISANKGVSRW